MWIANGSYMFFAIIFGDVVRISQFNQRAPEKISLDDSKRSDFSFASLNDGGLDLASSLCASCPCHLAGISSAKS
jgi:hypothetical protein